MTLPVAWRSAEPPLPPVAVAGRGAAARALARVLLAGPDRAGLRGVAGADLLVILGPTEALPWADGCEFLGRHPDAPGLLFPTVWLPDAPLSLYARAVLAGLPTEGSPGAPVALLRSPDLRVPLGAARPVDLSFVRRWLDAPPGAPMRAAR